MPNVTVVDIRSGRRSQPVYKCARMRKYGSPQLAQKYSIISMTKILSKPLSELRHLHALTFKLTWPSSKSPSPCFINCEKLSADDMLLIETFPAEYLIQLAYSTLSHPLLVDSLTTARDSTRDSFCVSHTLYSFSNLLRVDIAHLKFACQLSLKHKCHYLWLDVLCTPSDPNSRDWHKCHRHLIFRHSKLALIFPHGLDRIATSDEPSGFLNGDHLLCDTLCPRVDPHGQQPWLRRQDTAPGCTSMLMILRLEGSLQQATEGRDSEWGLYYDRYARSPQNLRAHAKLTLP